MSRSITYLLAFAVALCVSPALAGPLANDTTSIPTFHGTTPFQGYDLSLLPTGLYGTIDYAVWAPGTFPGAFVGYTPTPGDFVYTYQVYEVGPAVLSSVSIVLTGPTDLFNIGDFSGNNVPFGLVAGDPSVFAFIAPFDSANWFFDGILPGGSSDGLAFSSPNGPIWSAGSAIDDGSIAFYMPVPSPNPNPAPEPSTLVLASCGFAVFAFQWLRRRGRKTIL